ncbi:MAG TPA: redoxin domain-containing protein [Clostridia bacterium]|nr:redoxin domain-containing protein [Clostridia bacterium]
MFGSSGYNYERFDKKNLLRDVAAGRFGHAPQPGERAPDFELRALDGDKVRLSDFRSEKNVVLTFGSATCPQTAGSIEGMNDLYNDYRDDDVQFLFVYVREAHPGEELTAHKSQQDKVAAAEMLREEDEIEMPILVDDLNGKVHRKYGQIPNSTFIIDKSGRVSFRAVATRPMLIADALDELLERQRERGVDHAVVHGGEDLAAPSMRTFLNAHRALERGGTDAIRNFREQMGLPGKVAVTAGRIARPVADNPGAAIGTAAVMAGVVALGLWAGRELRRRRFESRMPYGVHGYRRGEAAAGYDDYEAVGI